jgi:hypothetical protein
MTTGKFESCATFIDQDGTGIDRMGLHVGWKYCPGTRTETKVFGVHGGVISHFTEGNADIAELTWNGSLPNNDVLDPASLGGGVQPIPMAIAELSLEVNLDDNSYGTQSFGEVRSGMGGALAARMAQLVSPATGELIRAGDYVWIDSRVRDSKKSSGYRYVPHGLLVVGWGPARSCSQVASGHVNNNRVVTSGKISLGSTPGSLTTLTPTRPGGSILIGTTVYYVVPYVSDFAGIAQHALQHGVPRPFYCVRYDEQPGGQTDNALDNEHFYFFSFPNEVTIAPPGASDFDTLFVAPRWEWEPSDRVLLSNDGVPYGVNR